MYLTAAIITTPVSCSQGFLSAPAIAVAIMFWRHKINDAEPTIKPSKPFGPPESYSLDGGH